MVKATQEKRDSGHADKPPTEHAGRVTRSASVMAADLPPGLPQPPARGRRSSVSTAVQDLSISVEKSRQGKGFDSSAVLGEHLIPMEGMSAAEKSLLSYVSQAPRSRDVSRACSKQATPLAEAGGLSRRTSFALPMAPGTERRESLLGKSVVVADHDEMAGDDQSVDLRRHRAGEVDTDDCRPPIPPAIPTKAQQQQQQQQAQREREEAEWRARQEEENRAREVDSMVYDAAGTAPDNEGAQQYMTQASAQRDPHAQVADAPEGEDMDTWTDYGRLMPDKCYACATAVSEYLIKRQRVDGKTVVTADDVRHEGVQAIRLYTATINMLHVPLPSLPGLDYEGSLDHNPYIFIGQCPPVSRVPCLCLSHKPLLPRKAAIHAKKHTLLLDLDETLVHSSVTKQSIRHDFEVRIPGHAGDPESIIYVHYRPGVHRFLREAAKHFEVVVFTASMPIYADAVVDALDPTGKLVSWRLFRKSCVLYNSVFVKNMSYIGRPLSSVVLVDNSPEAFAFQPKNGIPIVSWFDDPEDRELDALIPFLKLLAQQRDVRTFLSSVFRVEQYATFLREYLRLPWLEGDGVVNTDGT